MEQRRSGLRLKGEWGNIIKVACIYMATIIGAGFASGQEIVKFFLTYYTGGFYGILLAGGLFSIIGYIVLDKVYRERIRNYDELVFPMVGWVLGWIMEIAVTLFMLCLFCVMIAGMGNVVSVQLGLPINRSIIAVSILCMIVMLTDVKGIVTISTFVTPVLILGIIGTGLYVIICKDASVFSFTGVTTGLTKNWFFSALTYVSYNSIMSMVVMSSLLPYLKSRKVGIVGGIAGGMMLCIIALLINTAMFLFYPEILTREFPMLDIVAKYSRLLTRIYSVVLCLAMFISAITSGFYFIERVNSKTKFDKRILTMGLCTLVVPLAGFGFSNIISTVYPVFGYVGMFMVFAILLYGIRLRPMGKYIKARGR